MASVNTYLNFVGRTEEAFEFYKAAFGTEYVSPISRYGDMPAEEGHEMSEADNKLVLNVQLPTLGDHVLMGSDVPSFMAEGFVTGTNVSISLSPDTRAEADRLWAALSADGLKVEMPLEEMFWGDYYGAFTDKFGVQWMINTSAKE